MKEWMSVLSLRAPGVVGVLRGMGFMTGEVEAVAQLPVCDVTREGEERRVRGSGATPSSKVICEWDGAAFAWTQITPLHDAVTVVDTSSVNLTLTGQQISAAAIFGSTADTVAEGDHTHPGTLVSGSKTWDPGGVTNAVNSQTTVTVTGAVVGDPVVCSLSSITTQGVHLSGAVSASDTVTATLIGAPETVDIGSGTLTCIVGTPSGVGPQGPQGPQGVPGEVQGPSSSVDGEIVLFDGATGELIKRATGTGLVTATSGVYGTTTAPTFSDYTNANHDHADADDGGTLTLAAIPSVTSTAAELNILDGATLSTTELNYVDGVTSAIQTQLDGKQPLDSDLTTLASAFTTASAAGAASLALAEDTDNGSNTVSIAAPANVASNKVATLQDVTGTLYVTGGTDVSLADGGTGASLVDPNADRIMFWDDSAGAVTWLTAGTGLSITDTTIANTGSVPGTASASELLWSNAGSVDGTEGTTWNSTDRLIEMVAPNTGTAGLQVGDGGSNEAAVYYDEDANAFIVGDLTAGFLSVDLTSGDLAAQTTGLFAATATTDLVFAGSRADFSSFTDEILFTSQAEIELNAATEIVHTTPLGSAAAEGVIYASTAASGAVQNTMTETAFDTTYQFPANSLQVGTVIHVKAFGLWSTTGTPTLQLRMRWQKSGPTNVNILVFDAVTAASGQSNRFWSVEGWITVRSVGSTGTFIAHGIGEQYTTATPSDTVLAGRQISYPTGATTFDTTAAQTLQITAQWSASSTANTTTVQQMIVEVAR